MATLQCTGEQRYQFPQLHMPPVMADRRQIEQPKETLRGLALASRTHLAVALLQVLAQTVT